MERTELRCFLDGDALCIVNSDFVDLQESEALFATLDDFFLEKIEQMIEREKKIKTTENQQEI